MNQLTAQDHIPASHMPRVTDTPTIQWVNVTREDAIRWLEHNEKNRNLSERAVFKYEDDMKTGAWSITGAPIAFDTDGRLIDGQHRLTALARVRDAAFVMAVITGLPTEAQKAIDKGRARVHGDQLVIDGVPNGGFVSSSARFGCRWEMGAIISDKYGEVSDARLDRWLAEHPDHIQTVTDLYTPCRRMAIPPRIGLAVASRLREIDKDAADTFIHHLADGGQPKGDPTNTLRERMFRAQAMRERIRESDHLAWMIQAWNARRDHREVTKFQRPRGGVWTRENFPHPR